MTARFVLALLATLIIVAPASAQTTLSTNVYTVPYAVGTKVFVSHDHIDHSPPGRYDLRGQGDDAYAVAAAAPGTIRYIVDSFDEQRDGLSPCNNNYVWIEHANGEWSKYTHMEQGSVTDPAVGGWSVGDTVHAGDFLGYESNIGCASNDHLHFEVGVPANPADPIDTEGFLHGSSAENIIPRICGIPGQRMTRGTTITVPDIVPGLAEHTLTAVAASKDQARWQEARDCGYRLDWVDGFTVDGGLRFNLIFRDNPAGTEWRAYRRMSGDQYAQKFADAKRDGLRLTHVDSYLVEGAVRYAAVFTKTPGPPLVAYHGLSAARHQERLEELVADGYRPRMLSAVTVDGARRVTGVYEKRAVGGFEARTSLTPAEFSERSAANLQAGRRPVYVNAYLEDGLPRITAIWWERPAARTRARAGLSGAQYDTLAEASLGSGFATQAVAGYPQGQGARYVAFWAK